MPRESEVILAHVAPIQDSRLNFVAFPLGGIGAGMVCLSGTGRLTHVSIRHRPEVSFEPLIFAAIHVRGVERGARVLQGRDPQWKASYPYPGVQDAASGGIDTLLGLPKFENCSFDWRFPFANVRLADSGLPIECTITGWSSFVPGDDDDSSLPAAVLEYTLRNSSTKPVEVVFSYHSRNFLSRRGLGSVDAADQGFILRQPEIESDPSRPGVTPHQWVPEANLAVTAPGAKPAVNCGWFRGSYGDPTRIIWKQVAEGAEVSRPPFTDGPPSRGGSLFVRRTIPAGDETTIPIHLLWYVPRSTLSVSAECGPGAAPLCDCGPGTKSDCHVPWYASRTTRAPS